MYQRKSTGLYQPQRDLDLHFAPSTLLDEVAWQSSTLQTCFSTQLLESFVFFAQNAAELCQKNLTFRLVSVEAQFAILLLRAP
jgi:hypothetical protein